MIVIAAGIPKFGPYCFGQYFSGAFLGGVIFINEHGVQEFEQMTMAELGQYYGGN